MGTYFTPQLATEFITRRVNKGPAGQSPHPAPTSSSCDGTVKIWDWLFYRNGFKVDVTDAIFLPVFEVKVPPLEFVNREALGLHAATK